MRVCDWGIGAAVHSRARFGGGEAKAGAAATERGRREGQGVRTVGMQCLVLHAVSRGEVHTGPGGAFSATLPACRRVNYQRDENSCLCGCVHAERGC